MKMLYEYYDYLYNLMYGIYAKRSKITSKIDGKFENIMASKVIYHTNNEK